RGRPYCRPPSLTSSTATPTSACSAAFAFEANRNGVIPAVRADRASWEPSSAVMPRYLKYRPARPVSELTCTGVSYSVRQGVRHFLIAIDCPIRRPARWPPKDELRQLVLLIAIDYYIRITARCPHQGKLGRLVFVYGIE